MFTGRKHGIHVCDLKTYFYSQEVIAIVHQKALLEYVWTIQVFSSW